MHFKNAKTRVRQFGIFNKHVKIFRFAREGKERGRGPKPNLCKGPEYCVTPLPPPCSYERLPYPPIHRQQRLVYGAKHREL